ncbi:hypothetical protein PAMP_000179 [Pampus punctatissimus]
MSSADCLRLFMLCFWLLVDVNCEKTQRGYVLRVQAGQAPMGVHNDNRNQKILSEPSIFRRLTAGSDRGQSGYVYPAREQHPIDSKSSQIQSHYPVIPETHGTDINHFASGSNSASSTQRRNTVVYNRSGHKVVAFPDSKKIHQGSSESVFSTSAVKFSPRIYRARTKLTRVFSPVHVDNAAVGFNSHTSTVSPDIEAVKSSMKTHKIDAALTRHHIQSLQPKESLLTTRPAVSGYHSAHRFHNSFKPINKNIDSSIKEHSPGSTSAGKGDTRMSYPSWSPRVYSSDVMSEARGYAHVRHLRPSSDKTGPHVSSAAGRKFSETGFPTVNQNQGSYGNDLSKLGFGPGVSASSERLLNLNYNSRGSQPSSLHPPPPDRAQIHVQGKFKPFQRLPPTDDRPARTNLSDNEMAPTQEAAETTLPPSMNSTSTTVTGEMSTNTTSPMQTEAQDAELLPQASTLDGQSGSKGEVGPSMEQNKPDSPPKLQLEEDRTNDTVVTNPLETDQSSPNLQI